MNYQTPRNTRRESRTLVGRVRGGKLAPAMAVAIRGNEGGLLSQSITMELDPIAGRMITPIMGEVTSVFVPVQAIDAIKDPDAAYAGMTEVLREKLLSGAPLFGLEDEGEISKRCGVNPRSIGGVKKVNEMVRLAHNAAVNYLRLRKYPYASLLEHDNTAVTPAILGQTVLDRLNGVLDPDDRINGMVQLDLPEVQLPVTGVGLGGTASAVASGYSPGDGRYLRETGDAAMRGPVRTNLLNSGADNVVLELDADNIPQVYAQLNGVQAGGVSLTDFYNAEMMDRRTRTMREIVDNNPEYGEEMVLRWAHGLSVDPGRNPFVISHQQRMFGQAMVGATDTTGVEQDVRRSDMLLSTQFTVPVPRTELGGIIITFVVLKPDETLSAQPHPILSDVWGLDNFVADELALDPVPVTVRELDADCDAVDEATVAFYTGLNALRQTYIHYGLGRQLDPQDIENKTAVWQLEIPMSVTPENILYPADLDHYPFADQLAEVCTYTISSNLVLQTPMIFGPTPVEELAIIGDQNIFGQEDQE